MDTGENEGSSKYTDYGRMKRQKVTDEEEIRFLKKLAIGIEMTGPRLSF